MTDSIDAASAGGRHRSGAEPGSRRWLALGVIAVAQLMVVLDASIVNIALPSAQKDAAGSPTPTGSGW